MSPNLHDAKLLFPFSRIIVFAVNKGLQTLLIRKELTELLHLILSVDNCALLFTLLMGLNSKELSRGCSLLFVPVTTSPSSVNNQRGAYSSSLDTFPSKHLS